MSLDNYLGIFIDESNENLQQLNENLLKLEKSPDDPETLNEIFRVAHTLKGMSKTMGFNAIGDLTHHMENLLELLRNGQKQATGKVVDLLFNCLDKLEEMVKNVTESGSEGDAGNIEEVVGMLKKYQGSDEEEDSAKKVDVNFNIYEQELIKHAIEKDSIAREITVAIDNECVLPGARSYMVNAILEEEGEIFKTIPEVEEIEDGNLLQVGKNNNVVKFFLISGSSDEDLKNKVMTVSEVVSVDIVNLSSVEPSKQEPQDKAAEEEKTPEEKSPKEDLNNKAKAAANIKIANQTIRINAQRLDKLMNLVGELVINKTRVSQLSREIKNGDLNTSASQLDGVTGEIQEIVMKLRMVEIEHVFNRFPRLVRDISKNLGKEVNLIIQGKEIEIDRAVIDEIGDPLVHLIRNSLDHGLEVPEERIQAGKPAKGTLKLLAFNEGDSIKITIEDDGKGIDPEKIRRKAIEKGFATEEELKSKSGNEIIDLIFHPGLSTAETATDLSGRGVGMDVVRSKINSLGGSVSISSVYGEGTKVLITLPSTMAIIQSLLVELGSEIYALPLNYINEVIDVDHKEIKLIQNREVITLRGRTIPIVKLGDVLEVPDYSEDENTHLTVIIIKSNEKYSGVVVSRLIGQQEVVIKSINKKLCSENYISGATTLGSGEVALILNINAIMN